MFVVLLLLVHGGTCPHFGTDRFCLREVLRATLTHHRPVHRLSYPWPVLSLGTPVQCVTAPKEKVVVKGSRVVPVLSSVCPYVPTPAEPSSLPEFLNFTCRPCKVLAPLTIVSGEL